MTTFSKGYVVNTAANRSTTPQQEGDKMPVVNQVNTNTTITTAGGSTGWYKDTRFYPQQGKHIRVVNRDDGTMSPLLYDLLAAGGPYKSEHRIVKIITDFFGRLPSETRQAIKWHQDKIGNLIVQIGPPGDTLFSCHMDTVHMRECTVTPMVTTGPGPDKADYIYGATATPGKVSFWKSDTQEFVLPQDLPDLALKLGGSRRYSLITDRTGPDADGKLHFAFRTFATEDDKLGYTHPFTLIKHQTEPVYTPSVLGADDKLGCYIMLRMIQHLVPGLYIFHVGEECGAHGSNYIRKDTPEVLAGIKKAVAFDRKGYGDVITHQGGQTASSDFAKALSAELNKSLTTVKYRFSPCSGGIFTDTAVYSDLIPECSNLSVGYFAQHTSTENFDLVWLEQMLIPAVLNVQWEKLPATRKPEDRWSGFCSSSWWDDWGPSSEKDFDAKTSTAVSSKQETKPAGKQVNLKSFAERCVNCVPLREITEATSLDKVPAWDPSDGWIPAAPQRAMERMVVKYLSYRNATYADMANMYVELLIDLRMTEMALEYAERNGGLDDMDDESFPFAGSA